jgi:nucleoside-diphosphate-sugar epimerase
MKNVVVTGCAGFIGSWICDKLLENKYNVIGIDNLTSGVNFTPKMVEFYNKDINSDISNILQKSDFIVHAAAHAELRHNWKDIAERKRLFTNNEIATLNVLEQMPDVPMVFLSSASVYGSLSNDKVLGRSLVEDDAGPEYVESPYAASKLACETYVAAWSFKRKTPWYCLRLVNQVGSRSHRGVITDFLQMIRQNKHIHAADNGKQTKNWVHVEDTANTVIRLLDGEHKVPSGVYAVTSLERWSWRDIVTIMLKMYKEKYPNEPEPFGLTYEECLAGSIGDPVNLHVSGEKLKPYYSCDKSIEQAVRDALAFNGWAQ